MFSDTKIVLRDVGSILVILGTVMVFTLIIPLIFTEYDAIFGLFIPALITILIGLLLRFAFRKAKEPELRHAMITAALSWFVVAIVSSVPFILIEDMSILDSFFEAMSGWTGTGLTMVSDPSKITYTMQFWRSIMQWVGGVGVIVLVVSILSRPGTGSFTLYKSEAREEKIHPSVVSTVRTIWWIYLLFTVIGIFLFYLVGMSPWESINHCMTAIATGGFSVKAGGIESYNSPLIEISIIPIMLAGSIPFLIHYKVLKNRDILALLKDEQCKALLIFVSIGVVALSIENYFKYFNIIDTLRFSGF